MTSSPLFPRATAVAFLAAATLASACASGTTPTGTSGSSLVIYGSGAPLGAALNMPPDGAELGAAGSLTLKLYALYISTSADCSSPVLVQSLGAGGMNFDFMQHPVLFEATPTAGSYSCVMFRMSDVVTVAPAVSFGACVAGQSYAGDIYREGESDWKDVDLSTIVGHGTDSAAVDDHVVLVMTRDTAAAMARGFSRHQTLPLGAALVVPAQSTFHVDASQSVASWGSGCGAEPPSVSFQ